MRKTIEKASVVFKEVDLGKYEVMKSRDGQITLGGKYSQDFVEFYSQTNKDVLLLDSDWFPVEPEEDPIKVGEYVKVVTSNCDRVGQILKVSEIAGDNVACEDIVNGFILYGQTSQIVKASEEEIKQAKLAKQFSKIGRKPNEFKKGDIIRQKPSGKFYEVQNGGEYAPKYVELITPVEARFDVDGE